MIKVQDQNLKFVAYLYKKLKIFIFIFSNFGSSFFENDFHGNIPLSHGILTIPNLLNYFKCSKSRLYFKLYFKMKYILVFNLNQICYCIHILHSLHTVSLSHYSENNQPIITVLIILDEFIYKGKRIFITQCYNKENKSYLRYLKTID